MFGFTTTKGHISMDDSLDLVLAYKKKFQDDGLVC